LKYFCDNIYKIAENNSLISFLVKEYEGNPEKLDKIAYLETIIIYLNDYNEYLREELRKNNIYSDFIDRFKMDENNNGRDN
jgi:hypothetical protein